MRLFKFLIFFPNFFYHSPHQFLIFCNRKDVQKIPKGPPFYIFWPYATYQKLQKNRKIFFSIFSFLRAFVSSCRKSGFRVFLSLRYGADLGRSRLVPSCSRLGVEFEHVVQTLNCVFWIRISHFSTVSVIIYLFIHVS